MIWMNIDIPTKICTIHSNCSYVERKKETLFKGIHELKRDGGWKSFNSKEEAISYHTEKYLDYKLIVHC